MAMQRYIVLSILGCFLLATGCASRLPMRNHNGDPIPPAEVQKHRSNTNFILYTLGGGALSFGASFFIGSLVDRTGDGTDKNALWITTAIGTTIGVIYFAHAGMVRDHNLAVAAALAGPQDGTAAQQLAAERKRRQEIEVEKARLLREREEQEAERQAILDKLKKKKKKNNEGEGARDE